MPQNANEIPFVISIPQWLRDELTVMILGQIKMARMLQMRLIDTDRQHLGRHETKALGADVLAAVRSLDTVAKELDLLAGRTRILRQNTECMQHTMEFNAYCDREQAYFRP